MITGIILSALFFAGCQSSAPSTSQVQEKAPVTTLTGMLAKSGDRFVLREKNGKTTEIASYTLTFDQYVGKSITVIGQYSGTTLYGDSVTMEK